MGGRGEGEKEKGGRGEEEKEKGEWVSGRREGEKREKEGRKQ
jgi:hypothetical protein